MATLAVQRPGLAGAVPTYNACAVGGDVIPNDGRVQLHFKASGASLTAKVDDTISNVPQATAFDPDVTITVGAGAERIVGPFPINRFGESLVLTYPGGITGLTVAVVGS